MRDGLRLAVEHGAIFTAFGDVMRVPGRNDRVAVIKDGYFPLPKQSVDDVLGKMSQASPVEREAAQALAQQPRPATHLA